MGNWPALRALLLRVWRLYSGFSTVENIVSWILPLLGILGVRYFDLRTDYAILGYLVLLLMIAGMSLEKELYKLPLKAEIERMKSCIDLIVAPDRLGIHLHTKFYNSAEHQIFLQGISINLTVRCK